MDSIGGRRPPRLPRKPHVASRNRKSGAKARILRDVVERPSIYRTPNGFLDFDKIIDGVQKTYVSLGGRDADLDAVHSLVIWQAATTRLDEYYAANFAALSLQEGGSEAGTEAIARRYLKTYLSNQLDEQMLAVAGIKPVQELGGMKTYFTNAQMAEILSKDKSKQASAVQSSAATMAEDRYLLAVRKVYLTTIPEYVKASRLLAEMLVPEQATHKADLAAERKQSCQKVSDGWAEFTKELSSGALPSSNLKVAALKSAIAVADRAAACVTDPTKLYGVTDQPQAAKQLMLSSVQPTVLTQTFKLLQKLANDHYAEQSIALVAYETAMNKFVAGKNNSQANITPLAHDVALAGTNAGLFVCNASPASWRDIATCDPSNDDVSAQPLILFVRGDMPQGSKLEIGQFDKEIRALVARRILPVL
jgi:hypothetical protein